MTLKKLRESIGLNQKQVAYMIGVQPATFCFWESGAIDVPTRRLASLAMVFRVEVIQVYEAVIETVTPSGILENGKS